MFVVLIDAIVRSGGTAAPEANHVPPPPGWRDEDIGNGETCGASADEKKSYTEEQRQSVLRYVEGLKHFFIASPQFYTVTDWPPLIDPHCDCNVGWVTCPELSQAHTTGRFAVQILKLGCITLHRHAQTAGPESNVASHTTGYLLR